MLGGFVLILHCQPSIIMNTFFKIFLSAVGALALCGSCSDDMNEKSPYWTISKAQFINPHTLRPEYYVGTNFWYGPILASQGEGGNMERLTSELDSLKALGLTNLRVLVGGDGPCDVPTRVTPTLQREPGVYNDTLLVGLDRFMVELGKREMSAVLYLNNSWEWSGGYGMYLEWAGEGKALIPAIDGYPEYMEAVSKFVTCDKAKELFAEHLKFVIGRKNSITGRPYSEDPAIFSWQIGNEPRCFRADSLGQEAFREWLWESAKLIKSIDPNHLVSVGSEGKWGCEGSMDLYERIHQCPEIDYLTAHIWPYNWSWVSETTLVDDFGKAVKNTNEYIDEHLSVAQSLGKPLVIEEFGYPRDGFVFTKGSSTLGRDGYYRKVFSRIATEKFSDGLLAGMNFWGWGGLAAQSNVRWQKGDDYCGDPAQEQQGLNSVYLADSSTVEMIRSVQSLISLPSSSPREKLLGRLKAAEFQGLTLFGHQDDLMYGHSWKVTPSEKDFLRSDVRSVCGSYPAVLGLDLGGIELGDSVNLDGNDFGQMILASKEHYRRGGLVTLSWHPRNPLTGGDAWDVTSAQVVRSVLDGGEKHAQFMDWLKKVADFMEALEVDGESIPLIIRPWHEHTGSWFWWGWNLCSAREYKDLWKMTYHYLAVERGLGDRLVWAFSPNSTFDEARLMERYPGDEMVDIIGLDSYKFGPEYAGAVETCLSVINEVAARKNKVAAFTETGYEGIPDNAWWRGELLPLIRKFTPAYVLLWRNAHDKPGHFYVPYPQSGSAEDFRGFISEQDIKTL